MKMHCKQPMHLHMFYTAQLSDEVVRLKLYLLCILQDQRRDIRGGVPGSLGSLGSVGFNTSAAANNLNRNAEACAIVALSFGLK